MPYVNQERRINLLGGDHPQGVGDLNYLITSECLRFLPESPSYSDYNAIIGVLESAKLEFYRRAVAAYEDNKIVENGDIY